uniref:ZP domain-containing protein n=1 Tax=Steinernema glaseri TaxID=37863 RepID=A0A1I8AL94_9BILA
MSFPVPYSTLVLLSLSFSVISAAIDTAPQLQCMEDGLRLHFLPDGLPFTGHVYVKGFFFGGNCHLDYTQFPINEPFYFHIPYRSECNIRRERSINPPGISYNVVVIVQHHHLFLTQADRAYSVSCFYRENRNKVHQSLEIGNLGTTEINEEEHLPTCIYEVLQDSVDGAPVKFANIGDRLVHKWSCDSDQMGMLVHSCIVRDGIGNEFQLLDSRGCVMDRSLLAPLQYSSNLTLASSAINAFKFADQMIVHFTCQITLCRLMDNGCEGITPPTCQFIELPTEGGPPLPVVTSSPYIPYASSTALPSAITRPTQTASSTSPATGSQTTSTPVVSLPNGITTTSHPPTYPGETKPTGWPFTQIAVLPSAITEELPGGFERAYGSFQYVQPSPPGTSEPGSSGTTSGSGTSGSGTNGYPYGIPDSTQTPATGGQGGYGPQPPQGPYGNGGGYGGQGGSPGFYSISDSYKGYNIANYGTYPTGNGYTVPNGYPRKRRAIPKPHPVNANITGDKITFDVTADQLIIFSRDENLATASGVVQQPLTVPADCQMTSTISSSLWIAAVAGLIIVAALTLCMQRKYYERRLIEFSALCPPYELASVKSA